MPEVNSNTNRDQKRVQLAKEVQSLLLEQMKKAEQEGNWELFNRCASYYIKMAG